MAKRQPEPLGRTAVVQQLDVRLADEDLVGLMRQAKQCREKGAPSLTCCAMSSSTTCTGTMRKLPWYTGTTGQCRHRCLQPRLPSTNPLTRVEPSGSTRWA